MADATKHPPFHGGSLTSDLLNLFKAKKTVTFAYGFMLAFVAFTVFLAFRPSPDASSPWFVNIFSTSTATSTTSTTAQPIFSGSPFSSILSYFFPNTSSSPRVHSLVSSPPPSSQPDRFRSTNVTSQTPSLNRQTTDSTASQSQIQSTRPTNKVLSSKSQTVVPLTKPRISTNQTANFSDKSPVSSIHGNPDDQNATQSTGKPIEAKVLKANQTAIGFQATVIPKASPEAIALPKVLANSDHNSSSLVHPASSSKNNSDKGRQGIYVSSNYTASLSKKQSNVVNAGVSVMQKKEDSVETLMKCNLYDGEWVKDDSYPLYKPGSCPIIDEQFGCVVNGRPDTDYQKYKWKPKQCNIPRLDASHMLEMLRGKRLVFVGDSLNRNMWESLICILRNSVKDKSKVFEANGRQYFRGEAAYSFIFQNYNCSIELYVSPFLVQEWEMPDKNGSKKETLRLDLVGRTSDQYKGADILIFNTGHWWTHEKTSLGKDYYQEGSHVYGELNVLEAFRKALTTWASWVDANVNPLKSMVLFRGYSASHFSGGQWNSGGQCDHETVPIKNETYLRKHPPKMRVLERVLKGMKTHVSYMNITRMTDFRKDGHPSMYRKQNLTEAERRSPLRYQDCSHWCLPGVPDAWNEILYTEILRRQILNHQKQKTP